MMNFGPLTAEIGSGVWDTPSNFNGFRVLASLLQRRRSPEANLHTKWHLNPSSHWATTDMGQKLGAVPLLREGSWVPI